ncbi:MAG: type VI secretion system tube protein Hcp [Lacipirellulaceae bacterium]
MRISDVEGLYCLIKGGQDKYGYGKDNAGWFPIEQVNFGFNASQAGAEASGSAGAAKSGAAPAPARGAAPGATAGGAAAGGEEAFQTMSVSKSVDGVTTLLMGFAMEDRAATKADKKKVRKADIHFLQSVNPSGYSEGQGSRFVVPSLLITLQNVLIKGWSINGSGDDRPSESVELWFDKAAMRYHYTQDGKVWKGGEVKGWDQVKNEPWIVSEGEAPYFKQPDLF